jgi:hypothetical protein
MNAVLLTGAGFTKPFGGYLASEMWAAILNQPEVQDSPKLLDEMRACLNYETVYANIQAQGTEQDKQGLSAAIRNAFKQMDDDIRTYKPKSRGGGCCELVTRIVQEKAPTFIFTLNQDMFFERCHSGRKITVFPGVPEHLDQFNEYADDSSKFSLRLPSAEELESRKIDFYKDGFAQIAYVKLHGSQGWLSYDGSNAMVIGTEKASVIEKEPLLKWYFSLFEEVINRTDTRLLVVGYGFRDDHINLCIVNAIKKGLKLHVISPQLPQDFKDQFKIPDGGDYDRQVPLGDELWAGLTQYWPATLPEFFYDNWDPPGNLTNRGRILFRSLGLSNGL